MGYYTDRPFDPNSQKARQFAELSQSEELLSELTSQGVFSDPSKDVNIGVHGAIGNMNDSSFKDALKSIYNQLNGVNNSISDEQLGVLFKTALDRIIGDEQRAYDKSVRDEQRAYDSPTAMLNRLSAAGVGRSAAVQMLSGGSGSGDGGGLIGSGVAAEAPFVSASEVEARQTEKATAIANTVFGGLQTAASLIGMGFSIPQSIYHTQMLSDEAYMSKQQRKSYDDVNATAGKIQQLRNAGKISDDVFSGFKNLDEAYKYFANSEDADLQALAQTPEFQSAFGTSMGRTMLNKYWDSILDAGSRGDLVGEHVRSTRLQNALLNLDMQKVVAEIANINSETAFRDGVQTAEVIQRIAEGKATIQLMNKQGEWYDAHTQTENEMRPSLVREQHAQADIAENYATGESRTNSLLAEVQQGLLEKDGYTDMLTYTQWMDVEDYFMQLYEVRKDPEALRRHREMLLQQEKYAYAVAAAGYMKENATMQFFADHPNIATFCNGMHDVGGWEGIRVGIDAVDKGVSWFTPAGRVGKGVRAAGGAVRGAVRGARYFTPYKPY